MYARNRIDISTSDLASALVSCLSPPSRLRTRTRRDAWPGATDALVCFSVRSGFDLFLEAVNLPPGSEVLVSAVTIPDMVRILEAHGLRAVPIDLDLTTLAPRHDLLEKALTHRTRAILVAHLFGTRIDLAPIVEFAHDHGLLLLEDCAQAFLGPADRGAANADVSMFSFGPFKTSTALGGAVLHIRDADIRRRMAKIQEKWPVQPRLAYARTVLKFSAIHLVSNPSVYGMITMVAPLLGRDIDELRAIGNHTGPLLDRIRQRPSAPMLAVLRRRLANFDAGHLAKRAEAGDSVITRLPHGVPSPGSAAPVRTHWLVPVLCSEPHQLIAALRHEGFDATQGNSALAVVPAPGTHRDFDTPNSHALLRHIVYLPGYPEMPTWAVVKLLRTIGREIAAYPLLSTGHVADQGVTAHSASHMRVMGRAWSPGYLDETRGRGSYRLEVRLWMNLAPLSGFYWTYDKSMRLLWNSVRQMGVLGVARKVSSRRKEQTRNDKWLSCGVGTVLEADDDAALGIGATVLFVAPMHPRCVERVVLPKELVSPQEPTEALDHFGLTYQAAVPSTIPSAVLDLAGWTPYSGRRLDEVTLKKVWPVIGALCKDAMVRPNVLLPTGSPTCERTAATRPRREARTLTVIGFGNRAKTLAIPALKGAFPLSHVYELDPTQIGPSPAPTVSWDTAPDPRPANPNDVVLVGGFHHTHAAIAAATIRAGAAVIVEKPLVTTPLQLGEILDAMRSTTAGPLYVALQKRYAEFTAYTREDLELHRGDPITYSCIVHAAPLPERHWFRWPVSGDRIVSDGCHYLDHFLYLNGYTDVVDGDGHVTREGDRILVVELQNGSAFSMTFTERGSNRVGVEHHTEIRSRDRTARIVNDAAYTAESRQGVIRREHMRPQDADRAMYAAIAEDVVRGGAGDSAASVKATWELVLNASAWDRSASRAAAGPPPYGIRSLPSTDERLLVGGRTS